MTAILGISAFYHDSAAALVVDGEVRAAVQEERLTRIKHDAGFPYRAIETCLDISNVTSQEIDFVAFYEKPLLKFERVLETSLQYAPRGYPVFTRTMPSWVRDKLRVRKRTRQAVGDQRHRRNVFVEHHEAHAASAFYSSPFEEAAILTLDGVGEWATASIGVGRGNRIELIKELEFPNSIGLLYSAITTFCGFRVNDGEYKLMGLAPYGVPRYAKILKERVVHVREDGSVRLHMDFFRFGYSMEMTHPSFERLLGMACRREDEALEQKHADLAASIQVVLEEVLLKSARHARSLTGMSRLCLAGGVALNCVANARLFEEAVFEELWIQPAAGDAGGALGAAQLTWFQLLDQKRTVQPEWSTRLGPRFNDVSVARELKEIQIPYRHYDSSIRLVEDVSQALAQGSVVGWFQGAMEFGPRALGGRSLLADARSSEMQVRLNQRVKGRESFRPFAPMVSEKGAPHFFEVDQGFSSPYMTRTVKVRGQRESGAAENGAVDERTLTFAERLTESRSDIPSVTHVDQSARIQTVKPGSDEKLESLLDAFEAMTGVPVLINTSFNVKDEPIVCHPVDAVKCFLDSEMDLLVIENQVIDRAKMGDLSAMRKRLAQRDHSIRNQGQKTQRFPWGVVAVAGLLLAYFVLRLVLTLSFAKSLAEVDLWRLGVLSLLSVSSMIMFSVWPQSSRLAQKLLIGLLKPLGQGLSLVTLTLIYGFVVVPVALLMRMRGHDPLGLRSSHKDDSGWQTRKGIPKGRRYFRQFR